MAAWYEEIIAAHLEVCESVSHAKRLKSQRYFVWQEDGSNDLEAGNEHTEQAMTGRTDLYTKREFDPWAEEIGKAFSSAGIAWELVGVTFEEDTGFYHHSWDWEVPV